MQGELKIQCHSLEELSDIVKRVYEFGKDYNIWLLKGEMGAGKTTFVNTLIEMEGTRDYVHSPSYSLINEYMLSGNDLVYHFDFFRTESVTEIFDLGIDEYLESGNLCLIEWPELLEPYINDKHLTITILNPDKDKRIFIVQKHD